MKTKAIIFDFDGTLTRSPKGSNCWYKIWQHLEALDVDDFLYNQYRSGKIDMKQWMNLIESAYISKGLKKTILNEIAMETPLNNNCLALFEELKNNGIKIFVLSGGVKQIIELTLGNLCSYLESLEAYSFEFDENGVIRKIVNPHYDLDDKANYVTLMLNHYGFNPDEVFFVGNGANDETVYKTGVRTLCINPDDADYENKTIWQNLIYKCDDLLQIIKFL